MDGLIGTEYAKDILTDKRKILIDENSFKNDAIIMKGITSKRVSLKIKNKIKLY